jgi:hypothetical protein
MQQKQKRHPLPLPLTNNPLLKEKKMISRRSVVHEMATLCLGEHFSHVLKDAGRSERGLEWLRLRVQFATEEWANGCISSGFSFTTEDKEEKRRAV